MSRLDFERVYPHPRAKLWRALTSAELLARWLMPNDFEPRVGHRFTFRTEPGPGFDGIARCEVLRIEEPELLAFSWRGGPIDTVVTFRLEEVAGGTLLRFEQTGFRGFRAWLVRAILRAGFRNMYARKLPRLLDEMPDTSAQAGARGPADHPASPADGPRTSPAEPSPCSDRTSGLRLTLLRLFQRKPKP